MLYGHLIGTIKYLNLRVDWIPGVPGLRDQIPTVVLILNGLEVLDCFQTELHSCDVCFKISVFSDL